jgi:hypothetical protein
MSSRTRTRIGAASYVLWGLLHVVGGGSLLAALNAAGPKAALAAMASGVSPEAIPVHADPATAAVLAFHFWNLTWIGALVAGIGAVLNWRGSRPGFWINLALVAATDAGLFAFLLVPGVLSAAEGSIGLTLGAVAVLFTALGRTGEPRRLGEPLSQAAG